MLALFKEEDIGSHQTANPNHQLGVSQNYVAQTAAFLSRFRENNMGPLASWLFGKGSLDLHFLVERARILHWSHKKWLWLKYMYQNGALTNGTKD